MLTGGLGIAVPSLAPIPFALAAAPLSAQAETRVEQMPPQLETAYVEAIQKELNARGSRWQ